MKRTMRSFFVLLMAGILLLSSSVDILAMATKNGEDFYVQSSIQKIDKDVLLNFTEEKYVDVLIEMTEQVDTDEVAAIAKGNLPASASADEIINIARYSVVDTLRTTAKKTQRNLLSLLQDLQKQDAVSEFKSFFIVNMVSACLTQDAAEKVSQLPDVAKIYPDRFISISLPTPGEDSIKSDAIEWNINQINAPKVWNELGIDGTGVVVGMIDTGADWTHETLKEKWRGYDPQNPENPNPIGNWFDAVDNRQMPYDMLSVPHGTHVMGTILGRNPEGTEVIGVAPGAKWIAARAFTEDGGSESALLACGEYMLAPAGDPSLAPDVINNSWGGGPGISEWFRQMVQAWRNAGIVPVFAAGNTSGGSVPGSVSSPSNYPESYAVAATDKYNKRGIFSNQGPGPYKDVLKPDISAPGVAIRSAVPGGYESWNGTSMASPHITGVVALLCSVDSSISVDEVINIINETSIPLTDTQYPDAPNYGYGRGLVDAFAAVSTLSTGSGKISGTVLKEGSDTELPKLNHQPFTFGYTGLDIVLEAEVSDDVAISSVELLVAETGSADWTTVEMNQYTGDYLAGKYRVEVPMEFIVDPGFQYKIRITDFGLNVVETPIYPVQVDYGIVPEDLFSTDLSQLPWGFRFDGDWGWGQPTAGPDPFVGTGLLATNLDGEYTSSSNSKLMLPPLDLRNSSEASLRLHHWYDIEMAYDRGTVAITDDYGQTWTELAQFSGRVMEWESLFFDLSAYAGCANQVFVLFQFESDEQNNFAGWYLDNFSLVGHDTYPPGIPENFGGERVIDGAKLTWQAPIDADLGSFNIYRSVQSRQGYEKIATANDSTWLDTTVSYGNTYYYVVTSVDLAGNESNYSAELTVEIPDFTEVYFNDFEADAGNLSSGGVNNTWQWGLPTSGPKVAASGQKLWATNLAGRYSSDSQSWLELPELDLSSYSQAEIRFKHWFEIENKYDFASVQVSVDSGANWQEIALYSGLDRSWHEVALNLSEYSGGLVQLRFVFQSDYSTSYSGWYIDDVMVLAGNGATASFETTTSEDSAIVTTEFLLERGRDLPGQSIFGFPMAENTPILVEESPVGVPIEAYVSVVESGRTVRNNLRNGSYTMIHPGTPEGETWTLRVESYGYYTQEVPFSLQDGEVFTQDFLLKAIPKTSMAGRILDINTGQPIPDVMIKVAEDFRIPTIYTNTDGQFSVETMLAGAYTLKVTAGGYYGQEIKVDLSPEGANFFTIELDPFGGYADEIAYDSGNADFRVAMVSGGNGFGVIMTPDDLAQVQGVNVYLWGTDWPDPGSDQFSVAVFDTDDQGNIGPMVIEPVIVEGTRGQWNYVDLSSYGFITDHDFVVVAVQLEDAPNAPGIGLDQTFPYNNRSIMYVSGMFEPFDSEYGNVMIRSHVLYAYDCPILTAPVEGTYTNKETATVTGIAVGNSTVEIYNNGVAVGTAEANEEGNFGTDISLQEGDNILSAVAKINGVATEPSLPVKVIRDTAAPVIRVHAPLDGEETTEIVLEVSGVVEDDNLKLVQVNDIAVATDAAGVFSNAVNLSAGENVITVSAEDKAGNINAETIIVTLEPITRVFGSNRYRTAVAISQKGWISADTVVLARGDEFADALAGVPLAYKLDAPLLLTRHDRLTEVTGAEIERLGATKVIILGGPGAVSEDVANALEAKGLSVERIAGANRYETAALIASMVCPQGSDRVIVASGEDFPDALSVAPYAAAEGIPVLLARHNRISLATLEAIDALGVKESLVIGGAAVVGDVVMEQLPAPTRIFGNNRYQTNIAVAEYFNLATQHLYVATGAEFADTLAGAVLAAKDHTGILLVSKIVPEKTVNFITASSAKITTILGGSGVVSDDIATRLRELLK
ncbi:MAG TPA: hypothetical protein DG577_10375 [Firmicutes bacterium]|nr:hypothetical protein [Bacillota bacterium]